MKTYPLWSVCTFFPMAAHRKHTLITRTLRAGKDIEGLLSQPPSATCYINVNHPKAICHAESICDILTRFTASRSKWMSPQRPDDWPFPNSLREICQGLAGMVRYKGNTVPSLSNPDATTEQPHTKHWHPQDSGKDLYPLNCFYIFQDLEKQQEGPQSWLYDILVSFSNIQIPRPLIKSDLLVPAWPHYRKESLCGGGQSGKKRDICSTLNRKYKLKNKKNLSDGVPMWHCLPLSSKVRLDRELLPHPLYTSQASLWRDQLGLSLGNHQDEWEAHSPLWGHF